MHRNYRLKGSQDPKPGQKRPEVDIDKERFEIRVDGKFVSLPATQFDIFCMIYEADGRVISREDIMKKLWGWPKDTINQIQTRTIDQHVCRIRRALSSRPLIQSIARRGYKLARY